MIAEGLGAVPILARLVLRFLRGPFALYGLLLLLLGNRAAMLLELLRGKLSAVFVRPFLQVEPVGPIVEPTSRYTVEMQHITAGTISAARHVAAVNPAIGND